MNLAGPIKMSDDQWLIPRLADLKSVAYCSIIWLKVEGVS